VAASAATTAWLRRRILDNYRRALEGELSRTILSLKEIAQVRVHLVLPKESIFQEKSEPTKASVVVKLNAGLVDEGQDVARHLFGRERISLQPVRAALLDTFGANCFYCGTGLRASSPVDHVLPWSRVHIDGVANLVPACQPCNSGKSNALPAVETMTRVLRRDRSHLDQIGSQVGRPVQYERVCRAAQGLYRGSPEGAPTWQSVRTFTPLDLRFEAATPGMQGQR
jgi:hypothetical protein